MLGRIAPIVVLLIATAGCRAPAADRRASPPASSPRTTLTALPERPFVMFVSHAPDDSFKHVVVAPLNSPNGPRFITPLVCERVYFAASRGICLASEVRPDAETPSYVAYVFDEQFAALNKVALTGLPSRCRVSPDGRRAAITVFEKGHSYADEGFSTKTTIVDTATGAVLGDLEQFSVTRDGKPFQSADFNFWGLTFAADGDRFYATLRSRGIVYLVSGSIDARTAQVWSPGGECPSLSPDAAHVAFKKRVGGSRGYWQLAVADVATKSQRPLAGDTRSVDDQVEWLDPGHVIYFLPSDKGNVIWSLRTDADAPPSVFIDGGSSPSIVR